MIGIWCSRVVIHRSLLLQSSIKNIVTIVSVSNKFNLIGRIMAASLSTETVSKKGFKFTDYDCIGFDLDNTICRYKISNIIKLEYEGMAHYLIEKKGYSSKHLLLPIVENVDFMIKGLILDVENGNVLRIASDGHIMHGSHGTVELNPEELEQYYGKDRHWEVIDKFIQDPLHTWNGPFSEQMRTLLDYFDMPASLVFARAVDTIDEEKGTRLQKYNIWPDLLEALQDMFDKNHFQLDKGRYFPSIKNEPENYIHKCSDKVLNWLKTLRAEKKLIFLITGSNVDFATHTATSSMGPNWRNYFDIVVFFAKKPGFFTSDRPFVSLKGFEEVGFIDKENLQLGGAYSYGNWNGLHSFLKTHSHKPNPKIVYIGDNLIQDVYTPAVHTSLHTVAICEELEAEGAFGHDSTHTDKKYLISDKWGSYFSHKWEPKESIWHKIINSHAKLAIPSLEYVAKKPIDFEY